MRPGPRTGIGVAALVLFAGITPARASLSVCNQTSYVIYAATARTIDADNLTQGWTRIVPGDCRTALQGDLTARAYFLYARSSEAHSGAARAWGGSTELCAKDSNFALKTPTAIPECGDDAFTVPFAPLDTHAMRNWTATLTESAATNSLDKARAAGLERLLRDLGFHPDIPAARNAQLAQFANKMKLSPKAGSDGLFDALETEALKLAAPAGYTVCNDTAGVVWTALAFRAGKQALSAGWWKIAPGTCAHALTDSLKMDRVFIHAEAHNKPALVAGNDRFCVTNITFQIKGSVDCAKRGLTETGFAATNTQGRTGYTAHIGNDGLIRQAQIQAGTPK